jgi:thiamine-phosphate pyrophosphorylase
LLLYYITDRTQFAGNELSRDRQLLSKIAEAARHSVDYVQLREKDFSGRELEIFASEALHVVRSNSDKTKLLINSRNDVALAVRADGVHLRSDDISVRDARSIAMQAGKREWMVGVSCHSGAETKKAAADGADFVVFAPIFGKQDTPGTGIDALREACTSPVPVLALGGITLENARLCIEAGAAGVAGIRLFQDHDIVAVVSALRG